MKKEKSKRKLPNISRSQFKKNIFLLDGVTLSCRNEYGGLIQKNSNFYGNVIQHEVSKGKLPVFDSVKGADFYYNKLLAELKAKNVNSHSPTYLFTASKESIVERDLYTESDSNRYTLEIDSARKFIIGTSKTGKTVKFLVETFLKDFLGKLSVLCVMNLMFLVLMFIRIST
jgi:hypothetical protein